MSNTVGTKSPIVDVVQHLKAGWDAFVQPHTLGPKTLAAYATLQAADWLARFLPPVLQQSVRGLLTVGIQNVQSSPEVRGYTSALAIKSGRVPPEVLQRVIGQGRGPQQKHALQQAAKAGDLATVKSILRHNKKVGAPPQRNAPGIVAAAVKKSEAQEPRSFEERFAALYDRHFFAPQMARLDAAREQFKGEPGRTFLVDGAAVHVNASGKPATATRLEADGSKKLLAGEALKELITALAKLQREFVSGAERSRDPKRVVESARLAGVLGTERNALIAALPKADREALLTSIATHVAVTTQVNASLSNAAKTGLPPGTQVEADLAEVVARAEMDARRGAFESAKAYFKGRPGVTMMDDVRPVHVSVEGKPATATRLDADGKERILTGDELLDFVDKLGKVRSQLHAGGEASFKGSALADDRLLEEMQKALLAAEDLRAKQEFR